MTRLIVWVQSVVCNVENTRCPVSAAFSAVSSVSISRISPIRMTSGAWRNTCRSAALNDSVSFPTSRCGIFARLSRCRNSIGSSMVMMLTRRPRLMWLIIAASAVDLPDPVTPVTSTSPRGLIAISSSTGGRFRSRIVFTSYWIDRHADREVRLLVLGELLDLPRRHDLLGERLQFLRLERGLVEREQLAVHADRRRPAHLEQQVGRVALDHLGDGLLEVERRAAAGGCVRHAGPLGRGAVRTRLAGHSPRRLRAPSPRLRPRSRS